MGDIIEEYEPLTSVYDFKIKYSQAKGKYVCTSKTLEKDTELLVESPIVCWPLTTPNGLDQIRFCEHCLMLLSPQESIADTLPFCSDYCQEKALGLDDPKTGWYSILGGPNNLLHLRQKQSIFDTESKTPVPITLEGLARCVASILSRACQIKLKNPPFDGDECIALAVRPFERFVAPITSEYEGICPTESAQILQNLFKDIHIPVLGCISQSLDTLLSTEAVKQLYGQLGLNAQSIHVWGADINNDLTVLKAAGVYTLQSCVNHSCRPNCVVSNQDSAVITITTTERVEAGQELNITYIPEHLTLSERTQLLRNYLFICQCPRCIQERTQEIDKQGDIT